MGGNALAEFGARRFEREEYLALTKEVLGIIRPIVRSGFALEIPSYKSKSSFGDLDVLVSKLSPVDKDLIYDALGQGATYDNGPCYSILYKELQIDLIQPEEEDLGTSAVYYSYNDLGNLMGVLFKQFGLKYGHRGLILELRDGANKYDEIVVSKHPQRIFDFVGLNYSRFMQGFDTLEEVFDFVIGSPFFCPEFYQWESMNAVSRIRDKKRSSYKAFLEYIKDRTDSDVFMKNKAWYIPSILRSFPEAKPGYDAALKNYELQGLAKKAFNGNLIQEWTGAKEHKLGRIMESLRKERGPFLEWVLDKTEDELKKIAMDEFYKHQDK